MTQGQYSTQIEGGYPVSEFLADRLNKYLNAFRILVAVLVFVVLLPQDDNTLITATYPALARASALLYLALSGWFIVRQRGRKDPFELAEQAIATDVIIGTLLLISLGGLGSGIGILLVFSAAAAALMLPAKKALFFAASATVAIITSTWMLWANTGQELNLSRAGLYGIACFFAAIGGWMLIRWARDLQILAERRGGEIRTLAQMNELVMRRMRSGVLVLDSRNRIQLMNESAWHLLGEPEDRQADLGALSARLEAALQQWQQGNWDPDSTLRVEASDAEILPRFVGVGESRAQLLVFLDKTDLLSRRASNLAMASMARLSGSIAHEIRNPLAAISHSAQLLEEAELPGREQRMVEIISRHASRMNQIVETILEMSRREHAQPERIELEFWLEELRDEFQSFNHKQPIGLTLEMDESPGAVIFDPGHLHQLLWKLLENAADHAASDGSSPEVILSARRQTDDAVIIEVQDNGPGIPEERLDDIFEPFITTRKKGSGLGLYVAKQLSDANRAELRAGNSPRGGASFRLIIRPSSMLIAGSHADTPEEQKVQSGAPVLSQGIAASTHSALAVVNIIGAESVTKNN